MTNPLLAPNVFNPETFSPAGWEEIKGIRTISDLVHRNVAAGDRYQVGFTRSDWKWERERERV